MSKNKYLDKTDLQILLLINADYTSCSAIGSAMRIPTQTISERAKRLQELGLISIQDLPQKGSFRGYFLTTKGLRLMNNTEIDLNQNFLELEKI